WRRPPWAKAAGWTCKSRSSSGRARRSSPWRANPCNRIERGWDDLPTFAKADRQDQGWNLGDSAPGREPLCRLVGWVVFSSTFLRRARASRMRAARASSKAIVLPLQQRGPVVLVEHPRQPHGVHAVDQGVGPMFLLVGLLLVGDRDVPQERHGIAFDLEHELPVRPDERQQEEGILPQCPDDKLPFPVPGVAFGV